MKTTSKIFAGFFYAMFLICTGAALSGATHQIALAVICLAVAGMLHHDSLKTEEVAEKEE